MPAADDLYRRYMAAFNASARHTRTCGACRADRSCQAAAPLQERFSRLQEAWLNHLNNRRRG